MASKVLVKYRFVFAEEVDHLDRSSYPRQSEGDCTDPTEYDESLSSFTQVFKNQEHGDSTSKSDLSNQRARRSLRF